MAHNIIKTITTTASPTGTIRKSDANYNTARTAATGDEAQDGTGNNKFIAETSTGYNIRRSFFQFILDGTIPPSAIVKSAKFIIKRSAGSTVVNTNNTSLRLRLSTQPDSAAIAIAHYNDLGSSEYSAKAFSTIPNGAADIEMVLNATGIADLQTQVSAGAIFKAQCRTGQDVTGATPTGVNAINNCSLNLCELEITYVIGGLSFILA